MVISSIQLPLKLFWNGEKRRIKGPHSFTYPIYIYEAPNVFQVEDIGSKIYKTNI